jgi:hypothetical protein
MSIATHTRATNSVLRALSPEENQRLLAHSEQVDLTYGDILSPVSRYGMFTFRTTGSFPC